MGQVRRLAGQSPDDNWAKIGMVLARVSGLTSLETFAPAVLEALEGIVSYSIGSLDEVNPELGRTSFVVRPPEALAAHPAEVAAWPEVVSQHPVIEYQTRTGDGRARRLSDFLTQERLHGLDLYRRVYGPLGVEFQVAIGLRTRAFGVVGIALSRGDRDFDDNEVAVLEELRPYLTDVYEAIASLQSERATVASLGAAVEAAGFGVVLLDGDDGVGADGVEMHGRIEEILSGYLHPEEQADLPELIKEWAATLRRAGADPVAAPPWIALERAGRRLRAHFVPGRDGARDLMVLQERAPETGSAHSVRAGIDAP